MNIISFLFSLFIAVSAFASEIPAGCTASPNFSAAAYLAWASEAVPQNASKESIDSPVVPVNQRVELQLLPTVAEFTGFVQFAIPVSGTYVIATDAYPRINLTDVTTGENLDPVDFGKINDCGSVSKALRFEFTQPRQILLQFVSRKSADLNFLIWRLH